MKSKDIKQNIWIGQKDLNNSKEFIEKSQHEFHEQPDKVVKPQNGFLQSGRRDFLRYLGFSVSAATVAACETPIKKAIPYVVKPEEIVPGVATYYASTFFNGGDYCPVLVKTREGRPIKIEGNSLSDITSGGTSARAQASILSLYDVNRIQSSVKVNEDGSHLKIDWSELDRDLKASLKENGQIRVVSHTNMSPSSKSALAELSAKYPATQVITYDAVSSAAILRANEKNFGVKAIPSYHFDKADVIVSFGADFLGTWISPIEFASDYIKQRKILDVKNAKMSHHIQVESNMSLTGSNADNRILVKPSETGAAIAHLHNAIASKSGGSSISAPSLNDRAKNALSKVASELMANKGKSLVVSDSNNESEQILVNHINQMLGNYGQSISWDNVSYQRQGDEGDVIKLIEEMEAGSVGTLIVLSGNPVFDLPFGNRFADAMSKVATCVSAATIKDETSAKCHYIAPTHHYLESWGDIEAKSGALTLVQPTISPLFSTRQIEESILIWSESSKLDLTADQPYYEFVKSQWESKVFPNASDGNAEDFWTKALRDGVVNVPSTLESVVFNLVPTGSLQVSTPSSDGLEVSFYETINIGNGSYANNPWLQELPDPILRTVWGNYLSIPVNFDGVRKFIGMNDLKDGDLINISSGDLSQNVMAIQTFGQMAGTVAIGLGFGRSEAGACGTGVGQDVYPFCKVENDLIQYYTSEMSISEKTDNISDVPYVQYHHTMGVTAEDKKTQETINADEAATAVVTMLGLFKQGFQGSLTDRSILRHTNLDNIEKFVEELHEERHHHQVLNDKTLYPNYDDIYKNGHHWGMHVDLNACIGCAACTVACMSENNVPVVGKRNVARHQEMTWIRIDRYFYGDVEKPNVVYQPMMCQHCDNAPCENVCPVNATNHSSEGLNQMAYNRCVGTRYCANNCPFKVRRLNWSDYTTADLWPINENSINGEEEAFGTDNLTRMVLNPDVTVRARGVMEKCSFCVQRIQEGKLSAKKENRALVDSDVSPACQTACPTGAITFGDQNNKHGELSEKFESPLNYIVLEETNVRSSVNYSSKVINRDATLDA